MVPSAISAAKLKVSDNVGCGWMVRPMSSMSAPISSASTASAISSPAFTPTMPAPRMRRDVRIEQHLGGAFGTAYRAGAAGSDPREGSLLVGDALGLCLRFGQTHPRHFGIGVGDGRNGQRFEEGLVSGDVLRRDLAFMHCLVRQHRVAHDVADGEDVRHVGAHVVYRRG